MSPDRVLVSTYQAVVVLSGGVLAAAAELALRHARRYARETR